MLPKNKKSKYTLGKLKVFRGPTHEPKNRLNVGGTLDAALNFEAWLGVGVSRQGGAPKDPQWVHNLRANPAIELRDRTVDLTNVRITPTSERVRARFIDTR